MDTFVFISPNGIENCFSELTEDLYTLRHTQNLLQKTYQDLKIWVLEKNGKVVYEWGAEFGISLNEKDTQEFLDLLFKHESTDIFNFCAGVGQTFSESCKACNAAELVKNENIVYYSPELDLDIVEGELEGLLKGDQPQPKHGLNIPGISLEDEQKKPSAKQKVVEALMEVKKVAPELAQLRQQAPQIYDAVKSVVDAMILMAQGDFNA